MTVCVVTDRRRLSPEARTPRAEMLALLAWLEGAASAGIDLIQIRERDLPTRLLVELVTGVQSFVRGTSTRVVVNDRVDVAQVTGCDGVHLRGDSPALGRVRAVGPTGWWLGRSVHDVDDARTQSEADYLLFGAVYRSGPKPARGVGALQDVVAAFRGPVLAIGGITADGARACLQAGAAGVAGIGLFLPPGRADGALGLAGGVQALRRAIDPASTGHLQ